MYSGQIPTLLICPHPYHGTVVALVVSLSEAELAFDVLGAVLEDEDGRFVYLDGAVDGLGIIIRSFYHSMVDIGFFSCGDDTVNL